MKAKRVASGIKVENSNNREIKDYIHTICHDLVAPINSIRSYTEIIRRSKLDEEALSTYLNNIETLCDYGVQHINNLLSFTDKDQAANLELIELERIISDASIALHDLITKRNVDIHIDSSIKDQLVICNRLQITHLFQNLISNGIKFNKSTVPKIRIGILKNFYSSYKDKHIIYVADNGIGIPGKDQKRIFGMGQRGSGSEEFEGSGIGLTVVKKTIEDHNEDIWLETGKHRGTTFFFTLKKGNKDGKEGF